MTDAKSFEDLNLDDTEKQTIDLAALDALCVKMLEADGKLSRLAEQTKVAQKEFNQLAEIDIPEMMTKGGLKELKRKDGSIIKVEEDLFTSLPKIRAAEIMAAIRERGGEDMIKNELSVELGKGQDEIAKKIEEYVKELSLVPVRSETIAPQTYKKWIKTQSTSDKPIDLAFFGAYKKTTAKLVQ